MDVESSQTTCRESSINNRKRKQTTEDKSSKRSCEDGYSWWTAMMLGMPTTRQQSYARVNVRSVKY